jgi:hypothetical protein
MSRIRICKAFAFLGATALGCLLAGCTENDPCDDNEILVDGWCNPAPADAAADAAAVNPGGSDAGESEGGGAATAFGQTCMKDAECPAPTNYCAVVPGTPTGNCTASGCNLDASICPSGWTCTDLTAFIGQHICVPPGT